MLRYHPAHDPQHAAFRCLRLLLAQSDHKFHTLALRILDFFLLFPAELEGIRMPAQWRNLKIAFRAHANKYFSAVSKHSVFHQMYNPQTAGFQLLISRSLIVAERFSKDNIDLVLEKVPRVLRKRIAEKNVGDSQLIDFLVNKIGGLPLLGEDGLKHRTGLIEYRYDAP